MPIDREKEALDEIARTNVSASVAWSTSVLFVGLLLLPGLAHLVASPVALLSSAGRIVSAPRGLWDPFAASRAVLARIDAFEAELRNGSPVARLSRPLVQSGMLRVFGAGNTQVLPGSDGTLYFRPEIAHLLGAPFLSRAEHRRRQRAQAAWKEPIVADPRPAMRHFEEDLWRRGIELLVVPVPVKASVDSAGLGIAPGLVNRSWPTLLADLERHGTFGVDPLKVLLSLPAPRYLATDTHWRPEAMDAVASAVADELVRRGIPRGAALPRREPRSFVSTGDLADLLGVDGLAPDTVETRGLLSPPDPASARVLLLGDSFSNIYADPALGYGDGAGFAEALMAHLGAPVLSIRINAGGALQTRAALASQPELLDNIDAVVWEFTARELSFGDWRVVPLPEGAVQADKRWLAAGPGEVLVQGRVLAVAPAADPATAPYPDEVVAIRVKLEPPHGSATEAWLYAWGSLDRVAGNAARLAPDDAVTLRAIDWGAAPPRAHSASRSELSERPSAAPALWVIE